MSFKRKIEDIAIISSSNFGSALALAIFWLLMASILEKAEYGEIGYLMSVVNIGSAISVLGLGAVILVYESKDENVFAPSFFVALISSGFAGLIAYVLTNNIFVGLLIIGLTIFLVIQNGLNSKQKFRKYAIYVLLRSLASVTIATGLYFIFGLEGILLGFFVACLLILKELPRFLKNKKLEFSSLKLKIKFMFNVWSTRLSHEFFWWADKIIIGAMFGFSMVGSYYIASQYILLMVTLPRALHHYLIPQEARGIKNKQIKLFSISFAAIISILSIFIVPIGIEIFVPIYEESILPIQIMSLALIPLTIIHIQDSEFLGRENSRLILVSSLTQTCLYFAFIIALGTTMGLIGFALGFLISTICRTVINYLLRTRVK